MITYIMISLLHPMTAHAHNSSYSYIPHLVVSIGVKKRYKIIHFAYICIYTIIYPNKTISKFMDMQ